MIHIQLIGLHITIYLLTNDFHFNCQEFVVLKSVSNITLVSVIHIFINIIHVGKLITWYTVFFFFSSEDWQRRTLIKLQEAIAFNNTQLGSAYICKKKSTCKIYYMWTEKKKVSHNHSFIMKLPYLTLIERFLWTRHSLCIHHKQSLI